MNLLSKYSHTENLEKFLIEVILRGFTIRYNQRDKLIHAKMVDSENVIELFYMPKFKHKGIMKPLETVQVRINKILVDFLPAEDFLKNLK